MRSEEIWGEDHFFYCGLRCSMLIPRYQPTNRPVEVKEPQKISQKR